MRWPGTKRLSKREETLANRFLTFSWTRSPSAAVKADCTRAYIVLMHAEIESFLEAMAAAIVADSVQRFEAGRPNKVTLAALATYMEANDGAVFDPESRIKLRTEKWKATSSDWAALCHGQLKKVIGNNHGIREENIRKMFVPMGVDISQADTVWLADLGDLAKRRGAVAHTRVGLHQMKPAADQRGLVQRVIAGVPDFITVVKGSL